MVYSCNYENGEIITNGAIAGVSRTPFFTYDVRYTVYDDGEISVVLDGNVKECCIWLPRLGFELKTPYNNSKFSYFGMLFHCENSSSKETLMSCPSKRTLPEVGDASPLRSCIIVDFPEPVCPMIPVMQ
jgi:hypothetical protein